VALTKEEGRERVLLTWSSSLARRRPRTFAIGVAAMVLGVGLVWFSFPDEFWFVILAGVMLVGALGQLFFPVTYTLTDRKVYQKVLFSRDVFRWEDFGGFSVFNDGVYLRFRPKDLRLRYLKGLTVYFSSPSNREEVLDVIRRHLGKEADETPPEKASGQEKEGR
jgi:hypothetical protein